MVILGNVIWAKHLACIDTQAWLEPGILSQAFSWAACLCFREYLPIVQALPIFLFKSSGKVKLSFVHNTSAEGQRSYLSRPSLLVGSKSSLEQNSNSN